MPRGRVDRNVPTYTTQARPPRPRSGAGPLGRTRRGFGQAACCPKVWCRRSGEIEWRRERERGVARRCTSGRKGLLGLSFQRDACSSHGVEGRSRCRVIVTLCEKCMQSIRNDELVVGDGDDEVEDGEGRLLVGSRTDVRLGPSQRCHKPGIIVPSPYEVVPGTIRGPHLMHSGTLMIHHAHVAGYPRSARLAAGAGLGAGLGARAPVASASLGGMRDPWRAAARAVVPSLHLNLHHSNSHSHSLFRYISIALTLAHFRPLRRSGTLTPLAFTTPLHQHPIMDEEYDVSTLPVVVATGHREMRTQHPSLPSLPRRHAGTRH